MQVSRRIQPQIVALSLFVLAGCGLEDGAGPGSFQAQYNNARTALEQGRYDTAIAGYSRLAAQPGPLQGRLRLELAHSYLRAGQYGAASKQARAVASELEGGDRAAALAVQGTADHELGLAALQAGDRARGASFLKQADGAMQTVVTNHPDLDPLGALAARRASIAVRLNAL